MGSECHSIAGSDIVQGQAREPAVFNFSPNYRISQFLEIYAGKFAMTPSQQHETDFYTWTQEQAALLRALPRGSNRLDIDNLAEEIEDMGRAEIKEISSLLRQTLTHLIKIAIDCEAQSVAHWVTEVSGFQSDAVLAYSPGLKQRLDLPKIWKLAKRNAMDSLGEYGVAVPPLPEECPLTLDALLDPDFSPRDAAALLAAAMHSADGGRQVSQAGATKGLHP